MITSIYLDLDGTVVDFVRHIYRHAGVAEADIEGCYRATVAWDSIPKVLSVYHDRTITDGDVNEILADQGADFWASIPWLPWGRELLELCSTLRPTVLMTAPLLIPSCAAGKMQWVINHGYGKRVAITHCKHHMSHPGALLIDDGEHNISAFRAHGGQTLLWPAPWNKAGQAGVTQTEAMLALRSRLAP